MSQFLMRCGFPLPALRRLDAEEYFRALGARLEKLVLVRTSQCRDRTAQKTKRFSFYIRIASIVAVFGLFGFTGSTVQAQLVDWDNITNSTPWYQLGSNWSGGSAASSTETAQFNQAANYHVWWDTTTASTTPSVGFLEVLQGEVNFLNMDSAAQHLYTINGSGSAGSLTDFSISGAGTSATMSGMHFKSLGGGQIINGARLTLDGSHAQGSKLTVAGTTGFDVAGNLNINSGATFQNTIGYVGLNSGSAGVARVIGSGSQWNNSSDLYLGGEGTGTLNVESGGVVSNNRGYIGEDTGSTGIATVAGSGSQWNNAGNLLVGRNGDGTLTVESGGVVSNQSGIISRYSGSTGSVTVTGSGSQWNSSINIRVGNSGTGTMIVADGGVVSCSTGGIGQNSGSNGSATVTGSGSQWNNYKLFVGFSGSGTLDVADGGVVNSSGTSGGIGQNPGSTGSVRVTGSGSQWNSASLSVGSRGHGTLKVEAGGKVVSGNDCYIALNSGSTGIATVTGIGSQWNNSGLFTVGNFGDGTLNVESGGVVSNSTGLIGRYSGSTGIATVTGIGSQWNNSGDLYVGGSDSAIGGAGLLTIADSGLVDVTGATKVWSSGTLTLNGGGLTTGSLVNDGLVQNTGGTSTITGSVTNNGTIQVDTGSGLVFLSDLSGSGPFTGGGEVTFQGGLNGGNSPGTIDFGGDVTLGATSMTTIEIAGLTSADFDRLVLNNANAILAIENGAALDVQLINGFTLGLNQEFIFGDIAGSNSPVGTFSGLGEGDLVGSFSGIDLFISYGAGSGNDLAFFTAVPEPGALVMFTMAVGALGIPRRRRKRNAA